MNKYIVCAAWHKVLLDGRMNVATSIGKGEADSKDEAIGQYIKAEMAGEMKDYTMAHYPVAVEVVGVVDDTPLGEGVCPTRRGDGVVTVTETC